MLYHVIERRATVCRYAVGRLLLPCNVIVDEMEPVAAHPSRYPFTFFIRTNFPCQLWYQICPVYPLTESIPAITPFRWKWIV
jgi:hypothetical protein